MAQETWTKEQFWAGLEQIGEDEVRVRLKTKIYSDVNDKAALAGEWLLRKDQARSAELARRSEASQAEQTEIARSAKDAAWAAARAAETANKRATIALIIAATGAIISIIGLFLGS